MPRALAAIIALAAGCQEPAAPTCAELGCGVAASGDPTTWTPCLDGACWCIEPPRGYAAPPPAVACTRVPCSSRAPRCARGQRDEHAAYYDPYPALGDACFCVPD